MLDNNIMVFVLIGLYIFFIVVRYWKNALIFNIIATVPLISLILLFGIEQYALTVLFGVLMIVHISDFIFEIR